MNAVLIDRNKNQCYAVEIYLFAMVVTATPITPEIGILQDARLITLLKTEGLM